MEKRALLISYHFYPDMAVGAKRPSELCRAMQMAGYEVDVVAAKKSGPDCLLNKVSGLSVTRIPEPPKIIDTLVQFAKNLRGVVKPHVAQELAESKSAAQKEPLRKKETFLQCLRRWYFSCVALCDALKVWALMVSICVIYRSVYRRYSLVITSGPPMVVHNIGWLVKKLLGAIWIIDLRDPFPILDFIYPEKDFMSPDVKSKLRENVELYLEKKNLQISDAVITASPGIRDEILSRYPAIAGKMHVIYNGYDHPAVVEPETVKHAGDTISFLYAGTLYFNRNPFPLLDAFKTIITENLLPQAKIQVCFYGDCEAWNGRSLNEWIAQYNMGNYVGVYPPVNQDIIRKIMLQSDVLINFCQGQPLQIPAKTFDYIGSGKKSLVLTEQDSASALLIRESGSGIVIDPLKDNIVEKVLLFCKDFFSVKDISEANGHKAAQFSRQYQNAEYLKLINQYLG